MEFDINDLEFLTDGEEDSDNSVYMDVLQQLNILGVVKREEMNPEDVEILKDLLHGLTLAEKGRTMTAKGCIKVKKAIAKVPSLHKLSTLLDVIQTHDPDLIVAANKSARLPQTQKVSLPDFYKPKKVKVDGKPIFQCRICSEKFGSWVGCDSHIRKCHTNIQYGPCRFCNKFTSSAYDYFKRHEVQCSAVTIVKSEVQTQ